MTALNLSAFERGERILCNLRPDVLAAALTMITRRPEGDAHRLAVEVAAGTVTGDPLAADAALDYGPSRKQHVGAGELLRRRWPPTGDRELWIKYGPDGPPADVSRGEAA